MNNDEKCEMVEPKDYLTAFLVNRELIRDDVSELDCDKTLMEKVTYNYVIVKKILKHLKWQDQLMCKCVCKIWCDAVRSLQRELLNPDDFVYDIQDEANAETAVLKLSGKTSTEPMATFTFTNYTGFYKIANCRSITPCPCDTDCGEAHWLLDCIDHEFCYPKECNLVIKAGYLTYMPLPTSITSPHTINNDMLATASPFICGLYIPKIPNVQYTAINLRANSDMKQDFFDVVDKMAETRLFKGFLVFVTDKYLLDSLDDIYLNFLNHFKELQPHEPYALGGCIIEDTVYDRADVNFFVHNANTNDNKTAFISENVVSIAMFSVPKEPVSSRNCHFDMFSFVIESSDWSKPKIEKAVKNFADTVPHFENSVAFRLSCVGRDERHEFEQDTFRAAFPNTIVIGCYGNGEIGLNHPQKPEAKAPMNTVKRHKKDLAKFGIMYSYSTVFVYIGWGKMLPQRPKT